MSTSSIALTTRRIFFQADTTTVRLLLATASLGWTLVLLGNNLLGEPVMARPAYAIMHIVCHDNVWALLFFIHFAGVTWRLYDPKPRPLAALLVNAYGFAIWTISTAAINIAVGFVPPGSALEWTMCAASAWALYRTGLQTEAVGP